MSMPGPVSGQIARRVVVRGRVQGVGFRWHTRAEAKALGLAGWVRNRVDGTVEVHFQGDASAVEALTEWLRRGPSAARVSGLVSDAAEPETLADFELRATR